MQKRIKRVGGRVVGYGSIGLLSLLTLMILFPAVNHRSYATCTDGTGGEECISTQAETNLEIKLKTAISVALENQVNLEITPKSNGATGYSSAKLTVSTNSDEGYGIFLSTSSPDGSLISTSSNNSTAIANTALNNTTLSNLEKNSYGYALESTAANDSTRYNHIPTTSTAVKTTSSVTSSSADYAYGDTYYLSFGAKIGTDLPAGNYSGMVTVSAVANPRTIANLSDLTYMQEMSSDICTNTREGYTKQLIDTRDGKSYWVAKLKDGNCWMTQNLAFTITQEMIDNGSINNGNTDIDFTWLGRPDGDGWTAVEMFGGDGGSVTGYTYYENGEEKYYPPKAARNVTPTGTVNQNRVATFSWDIGKFVLATPFLSNSCEIHDGNPGNLKGVVLKEGDSLAELCKGLNIVDVSGSEWKPTYTAQEGVWILADGSEYSGYVTVNLDNHTYDAHYLFGNYYSYSAATAGTGPLVTTGGVSAAWSICPRGWQLPKSVEASGHKAAKVDKSFYNLLLAYGYNENDFAPNTWNRPVANIINPTKDVETNPAAAPLYWTRAGAMSPYYGLLSGLGGRLQLGSSSSYSESNEYHLVMSADNISPVDANSRDGGSVYRCVSK